MPEKLTFALVSPARELFSGEVDHVIAPGTEGEFGVLPEHAPFMSTLKNGVVRVLGAEDGEMRVFVRGGFADVRPDGLTILAEEAVDLDQVDHENLAARLEEARAEAEATEDGDPKHAQAHDYFAYLAALYEAAQAQRAA